MIVKLCTNLSVLHVITIPYVFADSNNCDDGKDNAAVVKREKKNRSNPMIQSAS